MQPFIFLLGLSCGLAIGAKAALAMAGKNTPPLNNITTVADILASNDQLKDYQVRLTNDTSYLYDRGKLIGATAPGHDGLDSLINIDNK